MGITYYASTQTFHLFSEQTSYMIRIERGYLSHLYWGRRLADTDGVLGNGTASRGFTTEVEKDFSLDYLPQELPGFGSSDFRQPAYQFQLDNGTTIAEFKYASHRILEGKPALQGLPSTYTESDGEATTLEITLRDEAGGLEAILLYTVFNELGAITRSVQYRNTSSTPVRLLRALSMSVDFGHYNYDMVQLSGSWAKERWQYRNPLRAGTQSVESKRGASSHQHNPFLALVDPSTTEQAGDAYGFSFVYSGSFLASVEVDQFQTTRVSVGINPFDFNWLLDPGEQFQTPEVVMVYSHEGLGGMSRQYHRLYRTRLCRGQFRDAIRPILVNNWEATYFDFDHDKLLSIAEEGKNLGIELFVLDDGWFGKRNDDATSLGDWFVNRAKLPGGIDGVGQAVKDLGMEFGLWFEPEMISPESELYKAHPDWCLHVPDRRRTLSRNQLVLDVSRTDVQDYIIQSVSDVLASAPITYVKWDMNRHMTEIGSALLPAERQRETAHRYMLGLYRVLEEITTRFPHVLFESCSGGGGRFDPGMLYYMPQTWTSDNTDAVERLKIQYGTSLVYPASSMGSHVTAVPNHQVHRSTPLAMRGDVALSGNFGYELDLTALSQEEKDLIKVQVQTCKDIRSLTQQGDMYRILSPFEGNETSWMYVSESKDEAIVFFMKVLAEPVEPLKRIKLQGLDPASVYVEQSTGAKHRGDVLMYAGLPVPELHGDFRSIAWHFTASK
ncbi:alpha-galactosidase [Paenibacillus sp. GCM10023252]|uniref:alpha-galactosidase n=1 Tax=Paenibacillus sp. GCM10023252 TaxID=3252649 RepID=UPI003606EADF